MEGQPLPSDGILYALLSLLPSPLTGRAARASQLFLRGRPGLWRRRVSRDVVSVVSRIQAEEFSGNRGVPRPDHQLGRLAGQIECRPLRNLRHLPFFLGGRLGVKVWEG